MKKMSNRLDQEREKRLQPKRISYAVSQIQSMGLEIIEVNETRVDFYFNGDIIKYFPYSGWHTGTSIVTGKPHN